MSRRDDGRMVFVIKCCRAEIDQANVTIEQNSALPRLSIDGVGRGWDGAIIGKGLVLMVDEENIFGLEIRVDQVEVVKNYDC